MNSRKTILLVEDNANDEYLTLRALKKYNVANDVLVARDGVEALDYLFCTGPHAEPGYPGIADGGVAGFEIAEGRWAGSVAPGPR